MDRAAARVKALELAVKSFGKDGLTYSDMALLEERADKFHHYLTTGRWFR